MAAKEWVLWSSRPKHIGHVRKASSLFHQFVKDVSIASLIFFPFKDLQIPNGVDWQE